MMVAYRNIVAHIYIYNKNLMGRLQVQFSNVLVRKKNLMEQRKRMFDLTTN
jgi:hypothetical protein